MLRVYDADAVNKVLGLEFDEALFGAAEGTEGEALLLGGDAVEEFLLIVVDLRKAAVAVLDGVFGGC